MLIRTVIDHIKKYHRGILEGRQIDERTTGDKILYGNPHQGCIGIITICWASVDVIREAAKRGANLIITHETLFWSHGGYTDWLQEENNQSFFAKKELLDETGIVVWRDHDYIHSGIPIEGSSYTDDIFYGVTDKLGWTQYITKDIHYPLHLTISKTTVKELTDFPIQKLQLNDVKIVGDRNSTVKKIRIPFHILGSAKDSTREADQEDISCYPTMEVVDFILAGYIRDSSMLGMDKAAIGMGHFNLEEPSMGCMVTYLPAAVKVGVPRACIQPGDMYDYRTR